MDRTGIEEVQVLKIQYFVSQYSKKNEVLLLPVFKHDGSSHPDSDSDSYDIVTLTDFRLNVTDMLSDAKNMHSSSPVA
jgi:hypothetical protein